VTVDERRLAVPASILAGRVIAIGRGLPPDRLMPIAEKHKLPVVEDACQGILADIEGKKSGTWGIAAGFSLHPLKNLNVWADGGIMVTNDDAMAEKLRLLRNHGLKNRDEIEILGYNSRLDSVQAIVGNWLIKDVHDITSKRIENAAHYDAALRKISQVRVPPRPSDCKRVFHLYIVFAERRDQLFQYCLDKGIEAKVHYPIPLYQQKGLAHFGYKPGAEVTATMLLKAGKHPIHIYYAQRAATAILGRSAAAIRILTGRLRITRRPSGVEFEHLMLDHRPLSAMGPPGRP
jgi:dTDP-4-amino-4,6-dideoxygalactose transaminase